jgi:hypothetical protein
MTVGVPVETRGEHLPNRGPERYRHTNLFRTMPIIFIFLRENKSFFLNLKTIANKNDRNKKIVGGF